MKLLLKRMTDMHGSKFLVEWNYKLCLVCVLPWIHQEKCNMYGYTIWHACVTNSLILASGQQLVDLFSANLSIMSIWWLVSMSESSYNAQPNPKLFYLDTTLVSFWWWVCHFYGWKDIRFNLNWWKGRAWNYYLNCLFIFYFYLIFSSLFFFFLGMKFTLFSVL